VDAPTFFSLPDDVRRGIVRDWKHAHRHKKRRTTQSLTSFFARTS
jgi:hypothetical protein